MKPETVVGIAVEDPDAASKVRRVVCVSVFIMILNVICYAVPFALTRTPTTIIMLLGFGFGIPACGYFGARNRSKTLVGCFWCCNGCNLAILIALLIFTSILLALFAVVLQFLPGYVDCCNQFSACDWNATTTSCQSCAMNQTDAPVVYMEGSDMCAARGGEPTPPSAFAHLVATAQGTEEDADLVAADSGSGGEETACLNQAQCQVIDYIKDWRVTRPIVGIFLALFLVLMIPTVLGCCFGCSLFNHPYMTNVTPYAAVPPGSVADTQAVSASSYAGGYEPTEPLLKPA